MQVIETGLSFEKQLIRRRKTTRIIVHHTAGGDVPAANIHAGHLRRGWSGFGYHYMIRQNGAIERGRPEHTRGAHAGAANVDSIGIALTGNFERTTPAQAQMDALVWLIGNIRQRHNADLPVIGHSAVMATACPGKLFPWSELHQRLRPIHTVIAGDTLWALARRYNVTVVELRQWNSLSLGSVLRTGQELKITGSRNPP